MRWRLPKGRLSAPSNKLRKNNASKAVQEWFMSVCVTFSGELNDEVLDCTKTLGLVAKGCI
jgi:hypothetical protein